jgi:hypothetical protein
MAIFGISNAGPISAPEFGRSSIAEVQFAAEMLQS